MLPESIVVTRTVNDLFQVGDIHLTINFVDGEIGNVVARIPDDDADASGRIVTLPAETFERIAVAVEERRKYGNQLGESRHKHVCAVHGYVEVDKDKGWLCATCNPPGNTEPELPRPPAPVVVADPAEVLF